MSKLLGLGALGTLWCLNLVIGFVIGPIRVIELSVVAGCRIATHPTEAAPGLDHNGLRCPASVHVE